MKSYYKPSIWRVDRKTAKKLENKKAREDAENKGREKDISRLSHTCV